MTRGGGCEVAQNQVYMEGQLPPTLRSPRGQLHLQAGEDEEGLTTWLMIRSYPNHVLSIHL